jgi:hypothetical protein
MISYSETANKVNYDLISFLENIDCTSLKFQVLQFWSRHPRAKMTFCAIAANLKASRNMLGQAMADLIEHGILCMQFRDNGLITYALTEDKEARIRVEELAALDWNETKSLARVMEIQPLSASPEQDPSVFYHLLSMA